MEGPNLGPEAPLLYYWHVLQKRKAIIAGFAITVILSVFVLTLLATPVYRGAAVIELRVHAP